MAADYADAGDIDLDAFEREQIPVLLEGYLLIWGQLQVRTTLIQVDAELGEVVKRGRASARGGLARSSWKGERGASV